MLRLACLVFSATLLVGAPLAASNIEVNTTVDAVASDGLCSLREAIAAANDDASTSECSAGTGRSDRIVFDLALPAAITLSGDLPEITESLAFYGPGVDNLAVDGDGTYRLFRFAAIGEADPWFVLSGLTLRNGLADSGQSGGALLVTGTSVLRDCRLSASSSDTSGGGLHVSGSATMERCAVLGNNTTGAGGGGGIYVSTQSSLLLLNSTVSGNSVTVSAAPGGGVRVASSANLAVTASTISGNSTRGAGGGIDATQSTAGTSFVTITSSTITLNVCGVSNPFQCGGGLRLRTEAGSLNATLANSIVADNTAGGGSPNAPDVLTSSGGGLTLQSGGYNLVGDGTGASFLVNGLSNDQVGNGASPIDPILSSLASNGGPTQTHLPDASSPVIDQGHCPAELRDQRGFGRPFDDGTVTNADLGCEIGAVEASSAPLPQIEVFADDFECGRLLFWSADQS